MNRNNATLKRKPTTAEPRAFSSATHVSCTCRVTLRRPAARLCISLRRRTTLQRVVPLLCNDRDREHALLGTGLVNTFPRKRYTEYRYATAHNNRRYVGGDVFCWVCPEAIELGPQAGWVISVEGWQLRVLQGRLRKDGAMIQLTVDKSSVAGYSPDGNDVSAGNWRISTVARRY
jgi:hypothetical protein